MKHRNPRSLLHLIAQTIYDKKGFNILAMDVRGLSSLNDYLVIGEGNVNRHVKGLYDAVAEVLKKKGEIPYYVEGQREGDWIVLDYGQIAIHLFIPELRDKYRLEEMWHEGNIVDVNIKIAKDHKLEE